MPLEVTRTIKRDGQADVIVTDPTQYPNARQAFRAIVRDIAELVLANSHLAGNVGITLRRSRRTASVEAGDGSRSIEYEIADV